ncbi:MAG: F0F1 ATP synthase subunit A [Clostridiales bacterium]|nr:F0F1 ATP synthase subunit A [Roseburia sp.]MDD7636684.1 F0F1 ATP synthase subunit A [Clostridiales bacterium]MDY4111665.1 F0F1 ATP synthase subunit A [Roseburia sp.]
MYLQTVKIVKLSEGGETVNNAILMSSGAENIDFMIHGIFKYEIFGQEVWITTSHVCILIVMLLMMAFAIAGNRAIKHAKEIPEGFQNVVELIVEMLGNMVQSTMGKIAAPKFVNYISTIFIFILLSNISGLFGLRPPTADFGTTFALGLITFFLIHITQFKNLPLKQIWKDMCSPLPPWLPIWLPINLISEIAVPVSLSLRLFANVLSGTVMMALVYGLLSKIALVWPAALHVYFDLFSGAIQTYVFCMLTMTYIGQNYEAE